MFRACIFMTVFTVIGEFNCFLHHVLLWWFFPLPSLAFQNLWIIFHILIVCFFKCSELSCGKILTVHHLWCFVIQSLGNGSKKKKNYVSLAAWNVELRFCCSVQSDLENYFICEYSCGMVWYCNLGLSFTCITTNSIHYV